MLLVNTTSDSYRVCPVVSYVLLSCHKVDDTHQEIIHFSDRFDVLKGLKLNVE